MAIGLGIVCFGSGVLVTKLFDRGAPRSGTELLEAGPEPGSLSAIPGSSSHGGSAAAGESGSKAAGQLAGKRGGPLPSVDQVIAALDLLDNDLSSQQLQPLLRGLGAEEFSSLLANLDRDAVGPGRSKALMLVAQEFGKTNPRAALLFAADPANARMANGAVGAAVRALVRESPEDALAAVRAVEDRQTKKSAMSSLMTSLASTKPELLRTWFEDEDVKKHLFSAQWQMSGLMSAMAASSPADAAEFAEKLPRGQMRSSGISGVASAWAQVDPKAALAWVNSIEDDQIRRNATSVMMGELVKRDPQAAHALLDRSEGKDRESLVTSIASGMAQRDPLKAMEWVATLEDSKERSRALGSLGHLARTEEGVEKFLGLLDELPDKERKGAGQNFVQNWVQRDPEAASKWVEGIEDEKEREGYFRNLISNLSYNDPEVAVDLITRMTSESSNNSDWYVQNAFGQLASRDLEGARAAAEGLTDGKAKNRAIAAILGTWANYEPELAANYVFDKYDSGPEQREMIGNVAGQWISRDQEAALAWAGGLAPADRVAASDSMISRLAWGDDSELAREKLSDLIEAHPEEASKSGRLSSAINAVMNKAGVDDPEAGIAIINQLETEDAQKAAIGPLVGSWASEKPEEAREWVEQLGAGPVRDSAAQNIVWRTAEKDSSGAFNMALSIENEEQRRNSIQHAIATWAKKEPEAARAALGAAEMSDRDRQRVLEQIE